MAFLSTLIYRKYCTVPELGFGAGIVLVLVLVLVPSILTLLSFFSFIVHHSSLITQHSSLRVITHHSALSFIVSRFLTIMDIIDQNLSAAFSCGKKRQKVLDIAHWGVVKSVLVISPCGSTPQGDRTMKSVLALFLLASMVVAIAGCTDIFGTGATPEDDLATPREIYPDVPVMAGMSYIKESSFIYNDTGQRICELKYSGKTMFLKTVQFYKERMRGCKWEPASPEAMGNDPITMEFKKGNELASIFIHTGPKDLTFVTVRIRGEKVAAAAPTGDKKTK